MIEKIFSKLIYLPFLIPTLYLIKIPLRIGSVNLLDLVLILLIILGLILIFKKNNWVDFKKQTWSDNFSKIILFFLISGVISFSFNLDNNWIKNLSLLKSFFILPIFFVLIIKYFFQDNINKIYSFLNCYFIYSVFLSFLTIFFWLIEQTTFDNRINLFFDSPNQLAIALSIGIISGSLLQIHKNSKIQKSLILLLIVALILTKSTGSIVAVSMTIFFLYNKKILPNPKILVKGFLIISILIITLISILPPILNKVNHNPFLNKNSLDSRLVIYLVSKKIITENKFTGISLANFQNKYLKKQSEFPPYPQWAVPHSHNLFIQIWLSFGLLGFISWVLLLHKKTLPSKNILEGITLYFLLYFLIHGLVDVPIWNNDQALFFWFIFIL